MHPKRLHADVNSAKLAGYYNASLACIPIELGYNIYMTGVKIFDEVLAKLLS
jgi:hypothetical protein